MKWLHHAAYSAIYLLVGCAHVGDSGTIAELDNVSVKVEDVTVTDGLDKAMESYQAFLEKTPESELTPDAIRRIADLKLEKEYGVIGDAQILERDGSVKGELDSPRKAFNATQIAGSDIQQNQNRRDAANDSVQRAETDAEFEKRTTQTQKQVSHVGGYQAETPTGEPGADLKNATASEAIAMYNKLLDRYPMYERNDQVLYQLSRAYEETGEVDQSMSTIDRLIKQYPDSRYIDEVQFRRGEYYFTRKKYLEAEEAYGAILKFGVSSMYYERALYKQGWSFYKQELYDDSLQRFMALLDFKISNGNDLAQPENEIERKRVEDTFRVISLSFSNLGGANAVAEFFAANGSRTYENHVYRNLAEFFVSKRRYSDATETYDAFVKQNPFHGDSPRFSMRVIEIYAKGGFPRLVVEAKKRFASNYGVNAEYWKYFNRDEEPEVMGYLKTNLVDLANHYHALYQDKRHEKARTENFGEAMRWYREFLASFPKDEQSPGINYQLAELLLENSNYRLAGIEYEHTAYEYEVNEKSHEAAYAAVYAYRENLKHVQPADQMEAQQEIVRSSLRLVDVFPKHEKATIVLASAVDDLFSMRNYQHAVTNGRRLVGEYPEAAADLRRGAWLVIAHSSFELASYGDAESAYQEVLSLTAIDARERPDVVDNLAASIYKQGEQSRSREEYREAVDHFLRIATLAPTSKIRPAAEYDAAAVLIQTMELDRAAAVLLSMRENFPGHELQHDVTKKIAFVFKEAGNLGQAANEYERIETESQDDEVRREALVMAAELYEENRQTDDALRVYRKYVSNFPEPVEYALETQYKIAMIYRTKSRMADYRATLQHIIDTDAAAGRNRTDRTRYLAARSSLVIIEPRYAEFVAMRLVKPFEESLRKKKRAMKLLVESYGGLVDYGVAEVTSASTFYIAEIYDNFNHALLESERPDGLSSVELEQYNLALEDQAYPFEEKTISVHEKNVELLAKGIYNEWIEHSIEKLAKLMPARYAKSEVNAGYISDIQNYSYVSQTGANPLQESAETADSSMQQGMDGDVVAAGQGAESEPGHISADAQGAAGAVQDQDDSATEVTNATVQDVAGDALPDADSVRPVSGQPGEEAVPLHDVPGEEAVTEGNNDDSDPVADSADAGREARAEVQVTETGDSAAEFKADAGLEIVTPGHDEDTGGSVEFAVSSGNEAVVTGSRVDIPADAQPGEQVDDVKTDASTLQQEAGAGPGPGQEPVNTEAGNDAVVDPAGDPGADASDASAETEDGAEDPGASSAEGDENVQPSGLPVNIEMAGGA